MRITAKGAAWTAAIGVVAIASTSSPYQRLEFSDAKGHTVIIEINSDEGTVEIVEGVARQGGGAIRNLAFFDPVSGRDLPLKLPAGFLASQQRIAIGGCHTNNQTSTPFAIPVQIGPGASVIAAGLPTPAEREISAQRSCGEGGTFRSLDGWEIG